MYNFSVKDDDFSVCNECNTKFISSISHKTYCSEECFKKARHSYVLERGKERYIKNRTCKHCGEIVNSAKKNLYKGGCCKNKECIEQEKKYRQRLAAKKYYNKNNKKRIRDKTKDCEASQKYRKTHKQRIGVKDKYRRKKKREWVSELKRQTKCLKCQNNKFYCLDFHHINPEEKDFSISHAISRKYGYDRILKEINKCVVLCKNCHSEVHYLMETNNLFDLEKWLNCKNSF